MPSQSRTENRLLGCLSELEYQQLDPWIERVALSNSELLSEPGARFEFAYFPIGCVLSSIVMLKNGAGVETTTAGNDGMVYVGLLADQDKSPYRVVPQVSGDCLRIPVHALQESTKEIPRLRDILQRYCLTLMLQSSQNSACYLRHSISERTARWLLECADRSAKESFSVTQDFLSAMLGVRRQSVNVTLGTLQRAGLIGYRRKGISIVDRSGLEAAACECYHVNAETYNQVMEMECADGVRVV